MNDRGLTGQRAMLVYGLLGIAISLVTFIVIGSDLSLRMHGHRVTATVTSCEGSTSHGKTGTHRHTDCRGDWRLPGDTTGTGTISGAADALKESVDPGQSRREHRTLTVFATDSEAMVARDDPTGWAIYGAALGVLGVGAFVVLAIRARRT